jgi:PAS domain-containing protein
LRAIFIQHLKDKKWVNQYLDRARIDLDDLDDKIPMAAKYHFPPELVELFYHPDTVDGEAAGLPLSPSVNIHPQGLSPDLSTIAHTRLQSIPAGGDFPCASMQEGPNPQSGTADVLIYSSLTSTGFGLSSSQMNAPSAPPNNIILIQSTIQQDLKLLVIAGILLIFVESDVYKQWIRHHMSLITLSEFWHLELEQSLRSLRNNFGPRSNGQNRAHIKLKGVSRSGTSSTPRKVKNYALHSRFSGRSPRHHRRSSPSHLHLIHPSIPQDSTWSPEEEKESHKRRALQEQERARRIQKHREHLKRAIFATLSLPVSGGQTLAHLLSTSDWLDSMLHFIHSVPIGIGVSSSSPLLFHQEKVHFQMVSKSQASCLLCHHTREDCPILFVNQQAETMAEVPRADILGYNLGHFLAMQYQERSALPRRCDASTSSNDPVNARNHNSNTVFANSSIANAKISCLPEEDEIASASLYNSSPYTPLKLDMAAAETHKPFSIVDPILHRIRELELNPTGNQKPIYFTFRQRHRDGRCYWHFVKCLPVHRTLPEVPSDLTDHSVSLSDPTQTTTSHSINDNHANSGDKNTSGHVENSNHKDTNCQGRSDTTNWPAVGEPDDYDAALAPPQRSPDGVYHILFSHFTIPDLSSAQLSSHRSSSSSSCRNMDTAFEPLPSWQNFSQPIVKERFSQTDMHHLAKNLQVIDDFLSILSVLI